MGAMLFAGLASRAEASRPWGAPTKLDWPILCVRRCYSRRISSIAAAGLRSFALLMK